MKKIFEVNTSSKSGKLLNTVIETLVKEDDKCGKWLNKSWKETLHLPGKVLTDAQLNELLDDAEKSNWTEHKSLMKTLDRKIENAKRKVKTAA